MKLSAIKPISYVKAHASEIIKELAEGGGPLVVTQNGESKAVIQSVEDYERTQETLAMLKLLTMSEREVQAGRVRPVADVFRDLRDELEADADKDMG